MASLTLPEHYTGPTGRTNRFFPPKGASESELLHYRDKVINRWAVYRNNHMARIALSIWYYLGKHWAEVDSAAIFDGVRGAIFREVLDDGLPKPVTNKIDTAVIVELISIVQRKWAPKIIATDNDPRIKAAAQVSHDALNYRLRQLQWDQKRTQIALNYIVCGTALVYTGWDRSYMQLRQVGAPSIVWCPSCQSKLYSDSLPADYLRQLNGTGRIFHANAVKDMPLDESLLDKDGSPMAQAQLSYCPFCEQPNALQPGSLTPPEISQGIVDPFGRPLTMQEPRGNTTLEPDTPFEIYPEDGGVRKTPDTVRRWGRRKIRSIDWLEERVPGCSDYINPDSPKDLLYDDPLLGSWGVLGRWHSAFDAGILDNHVNVDEVWEEPTMRSPLGRYCLYTKERCLIDDDLLEHATVRDDDGSDLDIYVPRVRESAARYKIRPTDFWGTTLPDPAVSPQNRLNGMDAQVIEARLRLGSPNLLMTPGMWVDGPAFDDTYGAGKLLFFQPDPSHPEMTKPEVFGGQAMDPGLWAPERNACLADIQASVGPPDIKLGEGVKNVGTTSGLQLTNDIYDAQAGMREDELTTAIGVAWSHMQQLQWVLRLDPETYRVLGPDGAWSYQQYDRMALRGQYEVEVEKGPYIPKSVYMTEAIREAQADGLYTADTPAARKKILEYRNLPTDVNQNTNNQIEQANRRWVDFADSGLVHVQDTIDDPNIHYEVLGTFLQSEEGQKIAREVHWEDVRRIIADWEGDLQRLQQLNAQTLAFYGGRLVGKEAEDAFAKARVAYQQKLDTYDQQKAIYGRAQQEASATGIAPPASPPPEPPQPPPPCQFLPPLLQDQIYMVWTRRLNQTPLSNPLDPTAAYKVDPDTYVRFRALVDAYRLSIPGAMPGPGATIGPAAGAAPPPPGGAPPAPPTTASLPEGGQH